MDNNPFRSQNTNMYSSPTSGQSQYPQTNAMPQSTMGGFNPTYTTQPQQQPYQQQPSYSTPGFSNPSYPQQQQPNSNLQSSFPQQQSSFYGQQQQPSLQLYPQQQQQQQQPYQQQSFQQQPYQQQQQQQPFQQPAQPFYWQAPQQQQPQSYDPSNTFIPPDFGLSSTHQPQQQQQFPRQPQHAPVDASAYLKGNSVRKMECPVCHKTIEGDNMALNHHVNEHLEYDMHSKWEGPLATKP
ncbi:hypothetical protein BDB00DRAFT_807444 [Zychaea mexicana]|uniref:uncharacterized protein n=1 Tax=Zychaea mexicana TaxID=64656 RepID=UPI0022FEADE4|nr:uncharacterized protein BDB00DRAFT_807444 [Zychaea mexicana]KAI9496830.1 hypothetical protein BDB00DRAFT_807444 [Zychaea mexicana]